MEGSWSVQIITDPDLGGPNPEHCWKQLRENRSKLCDFSSKNSTRINLISTVPHRTSRRPSRPRPYHSKVWAHPECGAPRCTLSSRRSALPSSAGTDTAWKIFTWRCNFCVHNTSVCGSGSGSRILVNAVPNPGFWWPKNFTFYRWKNPDTLWNCWDNLLHGHLTRIKNICKSGTHAIISQKKRKERFLNRHHQECCSCTYIKPTSLQYNKTGDVMMASAIVKNVGDGVPGTHVHIASIRTKTLYKNRSAEPRPFFQCEGRTYWLIESRTGVHFKQLDKINNRYQF